MCCKKLTNLFGVNMNQDQITAKMAEIQGESLNTAFALSTKAIERAQELADLNFSATKAVIVEAQDGLEQALTVKDPQAFVSYVQSDALAPLGNKLAAHQRAVAKIVRDGQVELAEVAEAQLEQFQEGVQNWVNTFAANAPAGSDVFVNALKTSVGSALQGFEQFQVAAKEAAAVAEANAEQAVEAIQGFAKQAKSAAAKPATRASAAKKPAARRGRK
jgi:phasin family protein